jgi:DNA-binding HxlR family transcriptional regulator
MAANRRFLQDDMRAVPTADGSKPLSGLPNYFSHPDNGDRLIYEKVRLGIMSALLVNSHLSFTELKDLLKTSDGNLSVHAKKLEAAGYISCRKSFDGRFPKTEYQLTVMGRQAFERYLNHMEALLRMARRG